MRSTSIPSRVRVTFTEDELREALIAYLSAHDAGPPMGACAYVVGLKDRPRTHSGDGAVQAYREMTTIALEWESRCGNDGKLHDDN